ncbi:MAG TPA: hypothetical protein VMD77_09680 [Candidatus Baltobacteraceae bacterium]|nr:hypothetical protein [Candidatus Baltobacteraceae bacterium]
MKKIFIAAMAIACFSGGAATLRAQDQSEMPPKVLVIDREMVKFGKDMGHEKNEAAFARAAAAAKSPSHYLATTTMSGPDEALFFVGYDSYAQWEEGEKFGDQPKVESVLGPLMEKDADYISDGNQMVAMFNQKWSYHPEMSVAEMRYFEFETIHRTPGHDKEWDELVALYQTAAAKANIDEHDIFYEVRYGAENGTVLIFTPRKSLADLDAASGTEEAFNNALGPDGLKRWAELVQMTVSRDSTELLQFDAKMSYPLDSWIKSDPDFWKPKPMMAPKPAAAPAAKKESQ